MQKTMTVNGTEFNVVSLLGKGKGGYSYLAVDCLGFTPIMVIIPWRIELSIVSMKHYRNMKMLMQ